jgi:hypothetical protein
MAVNRLVAGDPASKSEGGEITEAAESDERTRQPNADASIVVPVLS